MPPSRKNWNRAFSLLLILPYSLVAASPSKPHDLSPVLAGRDVDTAASTFNSQLNQDGSVTGSLIAELFPTGETTSNENPENTLLGYGDGNPQEKLISADPSEISRCGQNLEGVNQVPSGKRWFRRQKNDFCQPDAFQTKPGAVEQKTPVKDQIPVQSPDQGEQSPGLGWEPFLQLGKPQNGATNEGKCPSLDYQVAVCFAPWRSSVIPPVALLGGLMGLLDPVSLGNGVGCADGEEKWCCSYVLPHVDVNRLPVVPVPSPRVQAEIQANLDKWTGYTCVKQTGG